MKYKIKTLTLLLSFASLIFSYQILTHPGISYATDLEGRIVLVPERQGEAWYISPQDQKRYYLGKPAHALEIMAQKGLGVSNRNLSKIKPATSHLSGQDSDGDGLPDAFEEAVGTDSKKSDTSGNGYSDKTEIENGYDPLKKEGRLPIDQEFTATHQGRIFLQVENKGEAWYVNPVDDLRYFLGRPEDAFRIMKHLSLGITAEDLEKIPTGDIKEQWPEEVISRAQETSCPPGCFDSQGQDAEEVIKKAAQAIRNGEAETATGYFIPEMEQAVTYTVNLLNEEGRYTLANILSGSELSGTGSDSQKIFTNSVFFNGQEVPLRFYMEKRGEKWLLSNL
jgi:hypothetical protein